MTITALYDTVTYKSGHGDADVERRADLVTAVKPDGTALGIGTAAVPNVVVGNVASGATDSDKPVKVGAVFNTTPATLTTGQRGDLQITASGSLIIGGSQITGIDGASNTVVGLNASAGTTPRWLAVVPSVFNGATWDRQRSGGVTGMAGVNVQATTTGGASFLNIAAGQATTVVKSGAGTLYAIILNSAATATNTTTIYDNTAASGTVIGRPAVTTATVPTTLNYGSDVGLAFGTGLTIITATANGGDMTVIYK